jgi:hypothetical protein
MAFPDEVKATPLPVLNGKVPGFANLVPKPELLQGYADIQGLLLCPTAIDLLAASALEENCP